MLRRFTTLVLIPWAAAFLLLSGLLIADYGQTWDDEENFGIGHKFLGFYASGELRFASNQPVIPGHPPVYDSPFVRDEPFRQSAFANEVSAVCCRVFFSGLGWRDAVAAHHLAAPLFAAWLLVGMGCFVARHFNRLTACLAIGLLFSYPRFFGHCLSNIKDVPQVAMSSLALFAVAHWFLEGRQRQLWFWVAAVLFGLAMATKPDALLIVPVVGLWQLPHWLRSFKRTTWRAYLAGAGLAAGGLLVSLLVFALCLPPMAFPGRWAYLSLMVQYARQIAVNDAVGWNLFAPRMIASITPVLTLAVFGLGWVHGLRRVLRPDDPRSLLVIFALVPVLRHCLPGSNHYDGLRHFLVFLVPSCILAADIVAVVCDRLRRRIKLRRGALGVVACLALLVPQCWGIVETHPYQTTFFNVWVGGLGGAQAAGLPEACDYWCTSYRDAGRWLDRHAPPNSRVAAWPKETLIAGCLSRSDLTRWDPRVPSPPPLSYLVLVPRYASPYTTQLRARMTLVHRVQRQGGEIYSIYFQP